MELKNVILALGSGWQSQGRRLAERLLLQSRELSVCNRQGQENDSELPFPGCSSVPSDSIILTDDRPLAIRYAAQGFVCVGCAPAEEPFFEGAALVTDNLDELDADVLNECLLHAQGRAVTIAETGRLVIREIAEEDFARLCEIGRQEGMRHALENPSENCFDQERLSAYICHAYRLYGYGLWSVLLRDGSQCDRRQSGEVPSGSAQSDGNRSGSAQFGGFLIGCCGFAHCESYGDKSREANEGKRTGLENPGGEDLGSEQIRNSGKESGLCLELQYIVAENYRRQGYGEEMCRAALAYAQKHLDADEIWIRVKNDNVASRALAEKLGFQPVFTDDSGISYFELPLEKQHPVFY